MATYLEQLFRTSIPVGHLFSRVHPWCALLVPFFYFATSFTGIDGRATFLLLSSYVLLSLIGRSNPLRPLLLWAFVLPIAVLWYSVFPPKTQSVEAILTYPAKAFLMIAPWVHYGKNFDGIAFIQTLPSRLDKPGMFILGVRKYLAVCPTQIHATLTAFRLRALKVSLDNLEHFAYNLVANVGRHTAKYGDALELRGLDQPSSLAGRPKGTIRDSLLLAYLLVTYVGYLFLEA